MCAAKLKGEGRDARSRAGVCAVWGRRAMEIVDMVVCARPLRVISMELETRPGCLDGAYAARGSVSPVYPVLETETPDETGRGVGRDTVRVAEEVDALRAAEVVEERERMLVGRGRFGLAEMVRARVGVVFFTVFWGVAVPSRSSSSSQTALMRSGWVFRRAFGRGLGFGSGSYSTSTRSKPCIREEREERQWGEEEPSWGTSQRTPFDQSGERERDFDLRRMLGDDAETLVVDVPAD